VDKETLKMFSELLDSKLGSLENRIDEKLGTLENRLDEKLGTLENRLDDKLGALENRLDDKLGALENRLDNKLHKNTVLLENLTSKLEVVAEVQISHMGQNEKAHDDIVENIGKKTDVLELAIKDTSSDVKEIKKGLLNVEIITSSNWNDIAKLKSIK